MPDIGSYLVTQDHTSLPLHSLYIDTWPQRQHLVLPALSAVSPCLPDELFVIPYQDS